ncbi:unnamed protein product [Chrysodeixis includens]|uniref:Uncharacterized protein n=1 Tax=Chrysodeixis includens TaxID=689277 RepID=A0A9N8L674_CHRIL|nr:unnamed protein product [Chrysodeixis includens]
MPPKDRAEHETFYAYKSRRVASWRAQLLYLRGRRRRRATLPHRVNVSPLVVGVGKTSLVVRYIGKMFSKHISPTIGASFFTCNINLENARVWDTAGQERFRSMAPMYYRNANAALLVFDITSVNSFQAIKGWVKELQSNVPEAMVLSVVGNKSDLEDLRAVQASEAAHFAASIGAHYVETSALHDQASEAAHFAASIGAHYVETSALHDQQGIDQVFLSTASALLKLSPSMSSLRSYDSEAEDRVPAVLSHIKLCDWLHAYRGGRDPHGQGGAPRLEHRQHRARDRAEELLLTYTHHIHHTYRGGRDPHGQGGAPRLEHRQHRARDRAEELLLTYTHHIHHTYRGGRDPHGQEEDATHTGKVELPAWSIDSIAHGTVRRTAADIHTSHTSYIQRRTRPTRARWSSPPGASTASRTGPSEELLLTYTHHIHHTYRGGRDPHGQGGAPRLEHRQHRARDRAEELLLTYTHHIHHTYRGGRDPHGQEEDATHTGKVELPAWSIDSIAHGTVRRTAADIHTSHTSYIQRRTRPTRARWSSPPGASTASRTGPSEELLLTYTHHIHHTYRGGRDPHGQEEDATHTGKVELPAWSIDSIAHGTVRRTAADIHTSHTSYIQRRTRPTRARWSSPPGASTASRTGPSEELLLTYTHHIHHTYRGGRDPHGQEEDATHTGKVELPAWSIDSIAHGTVRRTAADIHTSHTSYIQRRTRPTRARWSSPPGASTASRTGPSEEHIHTSHTSYIQRRTRPTRARWSSPPGASTASRTGPCRRTAADIHTSHTSYIQRRTRPTRARWSSPPGASTASRTGPSEELLLTYTHHIHHTYRGGRDPHGQGGAPRLEHRQHRARDRAEELLLTYTHHIHHTYRGGRDPHGQGGAPRLEHRQHRARDRAEELLLTYTHHIHHTYRGGRDPHGQEEDATHTGKVELPAWSIDSIAHGTVRRTAADIHTSHTSYIQRRTRPTRARWSSPPGASTASRTGPSEELLLTYTHHIHHTYRGGRDPHGQEEDATHTGKVELPAWSIDSIAHGTVRRTAADIHTSHTSYIQRRTRPTRARWSSPPGASTASRTGPSEELLLTYTHHIHHTYRGGRDPHGQEEDATHTGKVELPAWSIDSIAHGTVQKNCC